MGAGLKLATARPAGLPSKCKKSNMHKITLLEELQGTYSHKGWMRIRAKNSSFF